MFRLSAVVFFTVLFAIASVPAVFGNEGEVFEDGDTFIIAHTVTEDDVATFGGQMTDVTISEDVELSEFGGLFDVDVDAANSQFSFTYVGNDLAAEDVLEQKIYIGITDLLINEPDPERSGALADGVEIEYFDEGEEVEAEGNDAVTFPSGGMLITIPAGTALTNGDDLTVEAVHNHEEAEEEDDDGVCVEQSSIPEKFHGHLVHSSPLRATVLCVKSTPELPCGTARHTLTVNGKASSYGEVCEAEACEKRVTYVNAVLKHKWENQVFADGKIVLTMGDSAVPPMLYSAAHIAVHFWRAVSGLAAPVVSSVLSAAK